MKFKSILLATCLTGSVSMVMASGDHAHDDGHNSGHNSGQSKAHDDGHGSHEMTDDKDGMFLKNKTIDGYDVSFHVMNAKDGMKMGDETHHLMIKVKENGKELSNIKINSKVVHPNGKAQSKMLMKMNGWYMAGYDLGHEGEHQLMILFKTADGERHSGGVHYSE